MALSQFIPALKIGFIATYVAPLAFVLCITIGKEAIDDWARYKRDLESNSAPYKLLVPNDSAIARAQTRLARKASPNKPLSLGSDLGQSRVVQIPSSKIKVGDLVVLDKNQRVPADMVLLQTFSNDTAIETEMPRLRQHRWTTIRNLCLAMMKTMQTPAGMHTANQQIRHSHIC